MPGAVLRLLIVTLTAGLVACGTPAASASGSPDGATPIAAIGTATNRSTGLPAAPDGFPMFRGAAPAPRSADPDLLARWLTDANGADVYDFYVEALPATGFEVELLAPGGAAAVINFRSEVGQLFELALTTAEGGTQIDLRVVEP